MLNDTIFECPVCNAKLKLELEQASKDDELEVPRPPPQYLKPAPKNKGWFKKKDQVEELTSSLKQPAAKESKPKPAKRQECEYILSNQTKCANMAIKGEKFCKKHKTKN